MSLDPNIDIATLKARLARNCLFGLLVATVLLAQLIIAAFSVPLARSAAASAPVDVSKPNIEAFGELLFARYVFLVETAGLILLLSLVGSVMLTVRERPATKRQDVGKQVRRRPQDAIKLTKPAIGAGLDRRLITDLSDASDAGFLKSQNTVKARINRPSPTDSEAPSVEPG